jgi:purine-binding chemotaxis protein CheW
MHDKINNLSDENLDTEGDTLKGKYLTFFTDNQLLGIPIADVVQIVGVQDITTVPDFPSYAKGIINLRGIIIPIIDVRLRLHKDEIEYTERTCIIVTSINEIPIGFIVDSVNEVTNIDKSNISDPPRMGADYVNTYLTGIAKLSNKVVLLLNTQKMLSEKEIELITNN